MSAGRSTDDGRGKRCPDDRRPGGLNHGRQLAASRRDAQGRHQEGCRRRLGRAEEAGSRGSQAHAQGDRSPAPSRRAPGAGRAEARRGARPSAGPGSRGPGSRRGSGGLLLGRNPVVEALRAGIPASALYVQTKVDADDRWRESMRLAVAAGIPILEVAKTELDRMSDGAVHQGLVLTVPEYHYSRGVRPRVGHARRGARRADRPAEPRGDRALCGRLRRRRDHRAHASLGGRDRCRLEDVGRCARTGPRRAGDQPDPERWSPSRSAASRSSAWPRTPTSPWAISRRTS